MKRQPVTNRTPTISRPLGIAKLSMHGTEEARQQNVQFEHLPGQFCLDIDASRRDTNVYLNEKSLCFSV